MMRSLRQIVARFRRAARDDEGSLALDFVLVFPLIMMIFLASFEAGMVMLRRVALERSLDVVVRDLRLGNYENPTHDLIKLEMCENAWLLPNCFNSVRLELRPVSRTTWDVFTNAAACVDRDEVLQPATTFVPGGENQLMLIRACVVLDPFFPTTRLGLRLPLDATGAYQVVAMSAFVNEPD
ncbi:MAG: TadE/TadG family type IV pilus assembly protein [Gemmobacter sp.]